MYRKPVGQCPPPAIALTPMHVPSTVNQFRQPNSQWRYDGRVPLQRPSGFVQPPLPALCVRPHLRQPAPSFLRTPYSTQQRPASSISTVPRPSASTSSTQPLNSFFPFGGTHIQSNSFLIRPSQMPAAASCHYTATSDFNEEDDHFFLDAIKTLNEQPVKQAAVTSGFDSDDDFDESILLEAMEAVEKTQKLANVAGLPPKFKEDQNSNLADFAKPKVTVKPFRMMAATSGQGAHPTVATSQYVKPSASMDQLPVEEDDIFGMIDIADLPEKQASSASKSNADLPLLEKEQQIEERIESPYEQVKILNELPPSTQVPTNVETLPGFDLQAGLSWLYPTNVDIRDYQFNIAQKALYNNTLVSLPTGRGKTLIAAVVIYNFYRWYPKSKILFLVPTKSLANQQDKACYDHMGVPQEDMIDLTGANPVASRKAVWDAKRVFFMTPQVAVNDLEKEFYQPSDISCVVVDEAHRATKNHHYCQLIQSIVKKNNHFRVLALTATPGKNSAKIQEVITNLLIARTEFRNDDSIDIMKYNQRRTVHTFIEQPDALLREMMEGLNNVIQPYLDALKKLTSLFKPVTVDSDPYFLRSLRQSYQSSMNMHPNKGTVLQLCFQLDPLLRASEMLSCYGIRCFYDSIHGFIRGEDPRQSASRNVLLRDANLMALINRMKEIIGLDLTNNGKHNIDGQPYVYSHPKMKRLEQVVLEHFAKPKTVGEGSLSSAIVQSETDSRVIIFSSMRNSVQDIVEMLERRRPLIRVAEFIGQSSSTKAKVVKKGLNQKQQSEVLNRFRTGALNVIVATSVGEEGLDIGEVDLIVCFDTPTSAIRDLQRVGRTGRKRAGKVIFLVAAGKEEQKNNKRVGNKTRVKQCLQMPDNWIFYTENPRMIPAQLKPVCVKRKLTLPAFERKVTSVQRGLRVRREITDVDKWLRSDKTDSAKEEQCEKKEKFLTSEESEEYYRNCTSDSSQKPNPSTFLFDPKTFHSFAQKMTHRIPDVMPLGPTSGLSLVSGLAWQVLPQTVFGIPHSLKSKKFVAMMALLNDDPVASNQDSCDAEFVNLYPNAAEAGYIDLENPDDTFTEIPPCPKSRTDHASVFEKLFFSPVKNSVLATSLGKAKLGFRPSFKKVRLESLGSNESTQVDQQVAEPSLAADDLINKINISVAIQNQDYSANATVLTASSENKRLKVREDSSVNRATRSGVTESKPTTTTPDQDEPEVANPLVRESSDVARLGNVYDDFHDLDLNALESFSDPSATNRDKNFPVQQVSLLKAATVSRITSNTTMVSFNTGLRLLNESSSATVVVPETPLAQQANFPSSVPRSEKRSVGLKINFDDPVDPQLEEPEPPVSPLYKPFCGTEVQNARANTLIGKCLEVSRSHSTPLCNRSRLLHSIPSPNVSPVADRHPHHIIPETPEVINATFVSNVEFSIPSIIPCSFPDENGFDGQRKNSAQDLAFTGPSMPFEITALQPDSKKSSAIKSKKFDSISEFSSPQKARPSYALPDSMQNDSNEVSEIFVRRGRRKKPVAAFFSPSQEASRKILEIEISGTSTSGFESATPKDQKEKKKFRVQRNPRQGFQALEFIMDEAEVSDDEDVSADENESGLDKDLQSFIDTESHSQTDPSYMQAVYRKQFLPSPGTPDPTAVIAKFAPRKIRNTNIFSQPFEQDPDYGSDSFVAYSDEESPAPKKKLRKTKSSVGLPRQKGQNKFKAPGKIAK